MPLFTDLCPDDDVYLPDDVKPSALPAPALTHTTHDAHRAVRTTQLSPSGAEMFLAFIASTLSPTRNRSLYQSPRKCNRQMPVHMTGPGPAEGGGLTRAARTRFAILPSGAGVRAGYVVSAVAAAVAGGPMVAAFAAAFYVVGAATGAPTAAAAVVAAGCAAGVDLLGVDLGRGGWDGVLGFVVFFAGVAAMVAVDPDVELGVGREGGVRAAVERVEAKNAAERLVNERFETQKLRAELGVDEVTGSSDTENGQGQLKEWDRRLPP